MARKNRTTGDGSITYREGRVSPWEARTSKKDDRKPQFKYFRTEAEAAAWLRQEGAAMDTGTRIDPSKITVEQWMTKWLETYVKSSVKIRTYEGYESVARCHIIPLLGAKPLQSITPTDVQNALNQRNEEGLSHRTISYIVATLRPALKQAMFDGLVHRVVTDAVKIPKGANRKTQKHALTRDEVSRLYDAIDDPRLSIAVRIMAGSGVRMGELLGLTWNDISDREKTLHVRRAVSATNTQGRVVDSPKNESSIREIPIRAALIDALYTWRRIQAEERLQIGSGWEDLDGVILTMATGARMRQEWISEYLNRAAKKAEVKCTPHILRHTYASILIQSGVDPETVRRLLGHATTRTVMEIYAHTSVEAQRRAVDLLGF